MIEILEEPIGDAYKKLITLAMAVCDEFILVKRDQLPLNQSGHNFIERIKPFLKEIKKQDNWPGTRLSGHYADVYYFKCTEELIEILTSSVEGLYSWIQPNTLEDLCFFKNQKEWLVTVSHERMGRINTSEESEVLKLKDMFQHRNTNDL